MIWLVIRKKYSLRIIVTLVITGAIDEEKSREIFEEFGKIKINEGVERKEKVEVIKRRQFKENRTLNWKILRRGT